MIRSAMLWGVLRAGTSICVPSMKTTGEICDTIQEMKRQYDLGTMSAGLMEHMISRIARQVYDWSRSGGRICGESVDV
jgi:hypothetical protein